MHHQQDIDLRLFDAQDRLQRSLSLLSLFQVSCFIACGAIGTPLQPPTGIDNPGSRTHDAVSKTRKTRLKLAADAVIKTGESKGPSRISFL
jgi:hypothetical protein